MISYPDSVRERVHETIRAGTSADELKQLFGIGRGTAYKWLYKLQAAGENVKFIHVHERLKETAFARFRDGATVQDLLEDIGVSRAQLYRWREEYKKLNPAEPLPPSGTDKLASSSIKVPTNPPKQSAEAGKDLLISQLKSALAQKTLEVDFFKGALREVEALRQRNTGSGEKGSTKK